MTHKDAPKVGVTREISTLDDYEITVTWAIGLDRLRYQALKYYPRFSTGSGAAFAVFGVAGANPPDALTIESAEFLGKVLHDEGYAPSMLPSKSEAIDDEADVESR